MSARKQQIEAAVQFGPFLHEAELHEEVRNFRAAFRSLLAGAEVGDISCQINLGNFYAQGRGTKKDLAKAAYWYKKAYAGGDSTAANNLAIDRRNAGNTRSAIFWFKRAIAMKDGGACIELARIYQGQRRGKNKAIALLRQVLPMNSSEASELDKENATVMLQELSNNN